MKGGCGLHICGFTYKELELLEKLLELVERGFKENLDEKAAVELKISPVTVRTRLCRMRIKYRAAKEVMREYRGWQQKLYQKTGGKFKSL